MTTDSEAHIYEGKPLLLETNKVHRVTLLGTHLWVRLNIDPADASAHVDRFILVNTDGSYRSEKTIKDDCTPSDQYVDLRYIGLRRDGRYTLQVVESDEADPYCIFENVPYPELVFLTPTNEPGKA